MTRLLLYLLRMIGTILVCDDSYLVGVVSRKDLLRPLWGKQIRTQCLYL